MGIASSLYINKWQGKNQVIYSNHRNLWDWGQIGTKLGAKHVIYWKLENFIRKKDVHVNRLESVSSLAGKCLFYSPEHNIMRKGDPMELNFEGFETQKSKMKKYDHLSCSVCPQSYGHENETNGSSFCIFCWWQQKQLQFRQSI